MPDNNDWDSDVFQIYMGEEDNYVPPEPCVELVSEINSGGGNANITLYPRSFHSFDGPNPLRLNPDAYSWNNCKFKLNAVTKKVYDPNNINLKFSDPTARVSAYRSCAVKGEQWIIRINKLFSKKCRTSSSFRNTIYLNYLTIWCD